MNIWYGPPTPGVFPSPTPASLFSLFFFFGHPRSKFRFFAPGRPAAPRPSDPTPSHFSSKAPLPPPPNPPVTCFSYESSKQAESILLIYSVASHHDHPKCRQWLQTVQRHYFLFHFQSIPLQWRHNECDGVLNHQRFDCLHIRLFRRRSKTSQLRVTGLCEGNSPLTGEFPVQRANNAENVPIWWRHHANCMHHFTLYSLPHPYWWLYMWYAVHNIYSRIQGFKEFYSRKYIQLYT